MRTLDVVDVLPGMLVRRKMADFLKRPRAFQHCVAATPERHEMRLDLEICEVSQSRARLRLRHTLGLGIQALKRSARLCISYGRVIDN